MHTPEQPTRLTLLTFDKPATQPDAQPCSGCYLCDCDPCEQDRKDRNRRGVRPRKPQPWDAKAA